MKSWDLAAGQIDEMMMILCIQFASIEVYSISAWERKYIVWLCYKIEMFEQIPHFFQIPNFFFGEGGYKKVRGISTCDQLCTHSNALVGRSRNKTETYRNVIFSKIWITFCKSNISFHIDLWHPLKEQVLIAASAFGMFYEIFSVW